MQAALSFACRRVQSSAVVDFGARRFYRAPSKQPPLPEGALIARTQSTPHAVRERREKKSGEQIPLGATDAQPTGLSPTEYARYLRLRHTGRIAHGLTPQRWLADVNRRRSRVRGFEHLKRGEVSHLIPVGVPVYLPNITFTFVPNHTPPGQPYNPYEATFYVAPSVTKTDIRSYLQGLYGVRTTYIRTDNYIAPLVRDMENPMTFKRKYGAYKRAVVGLVEPFYWPNRLEDMPEEKRKQREEQLEQAYGIQSAKDYRTYGRLRMIKKHPIKFTPGMWSRRAILRNVMERKERRMGLVLKQTETWTEMRARGEQIVLGSTSKPAQEQIAEPTK
ncbi:hypothetical protein BD626DRAFT_488531 [Schizophyllum amplum]|uniref:Large ribosomal subunit protein uL23m n=1 Tax=Schizophyllum amplum TaxID=97359 RepID=A0A550CKS4_9AGAR|nr:hypothetical protein BD626DRAFT_488531 [Auriculariopsis ampla]